MATLTRRALLRAHTEPQAPRLPWLTEDWSSRCSRCGDCLTACEEAILVLADGGFPAIDFSRGGCSQCGACAAVCQRGVFDRSRPLWSAQVQLTDNCLTTQGVYCQSCRDSCEPGAIRFSRERLPQPHIDNDLCSQCGMCIASCPSQALVWSNPA